MKDVKATLERWSTQNDMCCTSFSRTNLRASWSRVSRVEINNQRLLVRRTLESQAVLIFKSKIRSSLSNLKVKSSVLSGDGGGRCESRGRGACDGGDDGRGLHDCYWVFVGWLVENFMMHAAWSRRWIPEVETSFRARRVIFAKMWVIDESHIAARPGQLPERDSFANERQLWQRHGEQMAKLRHGHQPRVEILDGTKN